MRFKTQKFVIVASLILTGLIISGSSAMACACCDTFQVVHVKHPDVLNIRSGPGVRYGKVGSVPAGSACVIKTGRKSGKWHQISYSNRKGWVHRYYLKFMSSPNK